MTNISKKIITGSIAASFLLGGLSYLGVTQNQAFAEASSSQSNISANAQQKGPGQGPGHGIRGNNIVKEAATILGLEESSIQDSIKSGKTLAEIATASGITEATFLEKLAEADKTALAAQVTAGTITQEQADKIVADLPERLKQQIENAKPQGDKGPGGPEGPGGRGGMGFGMMGNSEVLTSILGITQEELRTELDAGKAIVDIAAAKGISEEELISKIKDGMTDSVKQFVESKHIKPEDGPAIDAPSDTTNSTTSATN